MTGALPRFFPTNAWVRAAIVPALVFIAMAADRNYLADFWHHLARGRAMANEHRLVDHDLFTFTIPGQPFQDVNWLTQLLYYGLYQWGGLDLVRLVNALVLAATLALLVALCRRKSGSLALAAAAGICVFFGLWQVLTIRPQTFSLLLFVVLYDLLDRSEERPGWLFVVPGVLALWANLHGAFPAGLMLLGCFVLAAVLEGRGARDEGTGRHETGRHETRRQETGPVLPLSLSRVSLSRVSSSPRAWQLALCLAASVLATLVNPYGWGIYQFVVHNSGTSAARRIDEWLPPSLDLWIGKAWLVSMVVMAGLFAAAWVRLRRRPTPRELVLVACFLVPACGAVRMVAWWLLICAPLAAALLADLFPRCRDLRGASDEGRGTREDPSRPSPLAPRDQPSWDAAVAFGLILVLAVMSTPALQRFNPLLAARLAAPRLEDDLEAVHQRLRAHAPGGRIYSHFEWGEYLSWSCTPSYKVFMDGRIEIYPDDVWEKYSTVTCGKAGWQKVLDDYGVDALLLDTDYHARTGLLPRVDECSGWERVFHNGRMILYLRTRPQARVFEPAASFLCAHNHMPGR